MYRESDIPGDIEERLQKLEKRSKTMDDIAEKYRNAASVSSTMAAWAKMGLYACAWFIGVLSIIIFVGVRDCNAKQRRLERAVDQCDCERLEAIYVDKLKCGG